MSFALLFNLPPVVNKKFVYARKIYPIYLVLPYCSYGDWEKHRSRAVTAHNCDQSVYSPIPQSALAKSGGLVFVRYGPTSPGGNMVGRIPIRLVLNVSRRVCFRLPDSTGPAKCRAPTFQQAPDACRTATLGFSEMEGLTNIPQEYMLLSLHQQNSTLNVRELYP